MQRLRCTTGHIGLGGDIYSTGEIFEVVDDVVAESLVSDGDAVLVEAVEDVIDMVESGEDGVSTVVDEAVVVDVSTPDDAVVEADNAVVADGSDADSVAEDAIAAAVADEDVPVEPNERKKRTYKRRT